MITFFQSTISAVHPKEKPPINVVGDVAGHIAIVVVRSILINSEPETLLKRCKILIPYILSHVDCHSRSVRPFKLLGR